MTAPVEAPETSGATTGGLLRYVRRIGGDDAVAEVLARAGTAATAAQLDDQSRWWSYDTRIRLFTAATEVLRDPRTMYEVGAAALQTGLAHSLVILLRAMGSPRQVFGTLPRAVQKFSTTSTMEILETGRTTATIRYRLHEGYPHSRLDCLYAQGLLSTVPAIFALPPAEIEHDECQSDGHAACIYRLEWAHRSRLPWRRGRTPAVDPELHALRGQLQILQSAATDLVASDDLETVLERIVGRAAEAVLAPAYLLAVRSPTGGGPLVHSAGVPEERVAELAAALLSGGDLGSGAVVADIVSPRRSHGRLAALYRPGDQPMGDEAAMLAAYAGHAAAALDLLIALEDTRREADRAGALLALAHALAAVEDVDSICAVVAEALPQVVGCASAAVMLWDPAGSQLQARASVNLSREATGLLLGARLRPEDTPELMNLLTSREPQIIRDADSSPALRRLLADIDVADVVAVPLVTAGTFLGVVTASWETGQAPDQLCGDVLARLRGAGDQAVSALQRARLLETVRHQAHHDSLTGLPNRVLFMERLLAALPTAGPGAHLGVLFCDLDGFKRVNDTLGHAAGDELLRQVAARLGAAVRPGDTVGRLSGDEFAIVLPGLEQPVDAERLAARVVDCFREPFRLEGREVAVGTSVGVAVHAPGNGAEDLLRQADAAMYRDKRKTHLPPTAGTLSAGA
ncbi:GGDEF domain-containing protein [Blastococcus sp. TF02-09]|uniref:sensor domain-containing diguanylate cyclase n=1 Tax=Blastococcus sp. TF02-09 TaxID=2250576 RepID=UPI000DE95736|nr:sensor domain-containing diguanylate cyclase [Blastococcus sp. TF02-9]RBY76622.1 GGDEF domain-containing protein [Blastococcus sp. TF02-9]